MGSLEGPSKETLITGTLSPLNKETGAEGKSTKRMSTSRCVMDKSGAPESGLCCMLRTAWIRSAARV